MLFASFALVASSVLHLSLTPLQKVMKGEIEPLDEWFAKVDAVLKQHPLQDDDDTPPPPQQQQHAPPPPVAVTSMPKKRSNRRGPLASLTSTIDLVRIDE